MVFALKDVGLALGDGQHITHNGVVVKLRIQDSSRGSLRHIARANKMRTVVDH